MVIHWNHSLRSIYNTKQKRLKKKAGLWSEVHLPLHRIRKEIVSEVVWKERRPSIRGSCTWNRKGKGFRSGLKGGLALYQGFIYMESKKEEFQKCSEKSVGPLLSGVHVLGIGKERVSQAVWKERWPSIRCSFTWDWKGNCFRRSGLKRGMALCLSSGWTFSFCQRLHCRSRMIKMMMVATPNGLRMVNVFAETERISWSAAEFN